MGSLSSGWDREEGTGICQFGGRRKTQGAQLAGGRLSKLIWGSGDGKKRVRCHATTERALRYPTGFAQYGKWVWEMRRRGAAVAIMLRIKEGLGSEAPSAPSCTSSLAAAAPSMKWAYKGGYWKIRARCRMCLERSAYIDLPIDNKY